MSENDLTAKTVKAPAARFGGKGLNAGIAAAAVLTAAGLALWGFQLSGGLVQTGMRNLDSWGLYITLFMFFGTLKANRALQFVFLSLTVLFALLAIGHLADNEGIVHVAGWVGLVCGASAIYLAMGEVLNEQFDRTILPIGEKH